MRARGWAKGLLATATLVAALRAAPAAGGGADDFSVRAGAYTDANAAFLGVEYRTPIAGRIYVAPNVEVAFPENGTLFGFSGDFHYVFPARSRATFWLGAGLGLYVREAEGAGHDTRLGANLLGGVGIRSGRVTPYMQLKVVLEDHTEAVLGFGIRF